MKSIQEIINDFAVREETLIIIDDGDTFIGNIEQLKDCFGITIEELSDWCDFLDAKYEVIE